MSKNVCVITGYKGTGKTTLLNELKDLGYETLNCDLFVHEDLYKKGQKGYDFIVSNFGINFVNDCQVDRKKLKEYLISNKEKLSEITHFVNYQINEYINKLNVNNLFVELPTYFDYYKDFDFKATAFIFICEKPTTTAVFKLPIFDKIYSSIKDIFYDEKIICFYHEKNSNQWVMKIITELLKIFN